MPLAIGTDTSPTTTATRTRTQSKRTRTHAPAPVAPMPGPREVETTPTCRGVIHGSDAPLPPALRAEIVALLAAALVADVIDFIDDFDADGYVQLENEL